MLPKLWIKFNLHCHRIVPIGPKPILRVDHEPLFSLFFDSPAGKFSSDHIVVEVGVFLIKIVF
jgi:hypothetical protein